MRSHDAPGRLHTRRLTLEPAGVGDAEAMARGIGHPDVARMLTDCPLPFTQKMACDWLKQSERDWRSGRGFVWSIYEAEELVGMISTDFRADGGRTLGYWIAKPYWGGGRASEAAKRVVDHVFFGLDAPFLVAGHFLDNPASARVLHRLRFREVELDRRWCAAREAYVDHRHVRLNREAWAR